MPRIAKWVSPVLILTLFAVALLALHHELRHYRLEEIHSALQEILPRRLLLALLLTGLSYATLTLYDWLGLRYAGRTLSYGRVAFASFTSYVFSYNIGFSVLGGAAVRYRLYSIWGFSGMDVTRVIVFAVVTFWLGLATLLGVLCLMGGAPEQVAMPMAVERALGAALVSAVLGYLAGCAWIRRPFQIRQIQWTMPRISLAVLQVVVASADLLLVGMVLFVLFPGNDVSLPVFLGVYLTALAGGLVSHVPGGLGVFEALVLVLLPTAAPHPELIAMLLAFRVIYYLIPFMAGLVLIGGQTALQHRRRLAGVGQALSKGAVLVTPRVLTFAVFFAGIVLLVSGATPAAGSRLAWLGRLLPVGLVEMSHFLASLCGVALLFLARGLQLRLNAAWGATLALLLAGALFSLVKGLDYEEAAILIVTAAGLGASHGHFQRHSSLWNQRFSPGWLAAIGLVIIGTFWIGFFAYKHVEYSGDLWWKFEIAGDAPRFLRASVGTAILVVTVGLARLFRPVRYPAPVVVTEDIETAMQIAMKSPRTDANLVALGDKAVLFSETRRSFLMYGAAGRSWVAMGDPVGDLAEAEDLVWRFRERCEAAAARTVFYEVAAAQLPLYVDLGLSLFKLGEEARVDLQAFSLAGGRQKGLRWTCSKLETEGCRFSVWEAEEVRARLAELRVISDSWLEGKQSREKGFSLGSFLPAYVMRFPAGVVLHRDRAVAFATLWRGADRQELSVDLMRYLSEAPPGTMEYLFIQLMLHGKTQGYHWFDLGMAPFSGFEHHPLAPLWNRLGSLLFRHGEHFYNFRGLRQYKQKFDPVWLPKYLACPGGLVLPRVLADVGALVSGGLTGLIRK